MIPAYGRTLVFGQGGSYKSTIIFDLCVAIAAQRPLALKPFHFGINRYGPVLLNSTEGSLFDNKERILHHARAYQVNPADLPLYYCQQPFLLDDPREVQELEYHIKEIQPVAIVLDPLDSYFSGDENSAKETKSLRRTLDRIIKTYELAVIVIHHETKAEGSPRGSSAWYGWADSILHVKKSRIKVDLPETIPLITVEGKKQRNGREGHVFSAIPSIDETLKQTTFTYYDGKNKAAIALEYWKTKIYQILATSMQPMTAASIAALLEQRPEKISEALEALEVDGLASRDGVVQRRFGAQGSRTRDVLAWQAVRLANVVDLAEYMVKKDIAIYEEELTAYDVQPLNPEPILVKSFYPDRVHPAGATA